MKRLLITLLLFYAISTFGQKIQKNTGSVAPAYNGFWRCTKIATLQKQNERTRFSMEFEEKVKTDYLFQIQNDTMIFKSGCKIKFAYWRGRFNKTKYQAVEKTLVKDKFNFTIKDTIGFFVDVSSLKTMELPECENLKFGDIIVVNQSKLIFSIVNDFYLFEKNSQPNGKECFNSDCPNCKVIRKEMEYKEVYTFRNKEINNIYKLFYNTYYNQQDFRGLSQELPLSDTKTAFEKLGQTYTYKWTTKNKMNLEIGYDGGVTTISFEQHDKNVIATMTYNAD